MHYVSIEMLDIGNVKTVLALSVSDEGPYCSKCINGSAISQVSHYRFPPTVGTEIWIDGEYRICVNCMVLILRKTHLRSPI